MDMRGALYQSISHLHFSAFPGKKMGGKKQD